MFWLTTILKQCHEGKPYYVMQSNSQKLKHHYLQAVDFFI